MLRYGIIVAALSLALSGCAGRLAERAAQPSEGVLPPVLNPITRMNATLRSLPPPQQKIAIAVYGYQDQTGQFKTGDTFQHLSRAVTQGATSVLIKALQDAGGGTWFTVVEREKLDNLLKERRIIADMRNIYLGERAVNPKALPPLLFAGVLLEGGIIGYDTNTRTGGAGARYLGIGGDIQYREDTVTIYLRAISTKTGEVMVSVVAHKTVLSVALRGSAFKFVALDRILEAEAGFSNNEPEQIAVQQAIEKAVHALIVEGSARNIWGFADKAFQRKAIERLDAEQLLERREAEQRLSQNQSNGGRQPAANAVASAGAQSAPAGQPQNANGVATGNGAATAPARAAAATSSGWDASTQRETQSQPAPANSPAPPAAAPARSVRVANRAGGN